MSDPNQEESLLSAIEGNDDGMNKSDLILTVQLLRRGRARAQKECAELKDSILILTRQHDLEISSYKAALRVCIQYLEISDICGPRPDIHKLRTAKKETETQSRQLLNL